MSFNAYLPFINSGLRGMLNRPVLGKDQALETVDYSDLIPEFPSLSDQWSIRIPYFRAPHPASALSTPNQMISKILPGDAYSFTNENDYLEQYRSSYFALTPKKGGWDTMRLVEICASGCFPLIPGLERAPKGTLSGHPIELFLRLWKDTSTGVVLPPNQASRVKLQNFAQKWISASHQAESVLARIGSSTTRKVTYTVLGDNFQFDYVAHGFLLGFSQILDTKNLTLLGSVPPSLTVGYSGEFVKHYYGGGFSYAGALTDKLHLHETDQNVVNPADILNFLKSAAVRPDVLVVSRAELIDGDEASPSSIWLDIAAEVESLIFLDGGDFPPTKSKTQYFREFSYYFQREY